VDDCEPPPRLDGVFNRVTRRQIRGGVIQRLPRIGAHQDSNGLGLQNRVWQIGFVLVFYCCYWKKGENTRQ